MSSTITYRLIESFEDKSIKPEKWNELLSHGSTDVIFMTWQWQRAWWQAFGRGKLLIVIAEKNEKIIAIAPLFSEYGMIYFVGSGGSDYLDFIGGISDEILEGLFLKAIEEIEAYAGFQFYHIPETSASHRILQTISNKNGWKYFDEGSLSSPMLSIRDFPEKAKEAIKKKSLVRHENWFERNGGLAVEHLSDGKEILPLLEDFYEQHISRWQQTKFPSFFLNEKHRRFIELLSTSATETKWFRFTRIIWQKRNIAFHFGFHYKGNFFWYKPSFDISLADHSPGEVLLRQLLLQALAENADVFDFGLGDETFKDRFATETRIVKNCGLYPLKSKKILVISPHPDDESIGCGGTIRKHVVDGDHVEVIFLTSGEKGGNGKSRTDDVISMREKESVKAADILQIKGIDFWREADGNFQPTENNQRRLIEKIRDFNPDIIYVPHDKEDHPDHRAATSLVRQVIASLPDKIKKPEVLMYEVWTPIQKFEHIVDISSFVDDKRNAIRAYESQCSMVQFDEAILALNRYRGEMHSWPGGNYAEVFQKLVP